MNINNKISYTIVINILLVIITFATSIIITNLLGPVGFGQYKYILTVAFTIVLFTNCGLPDMLNVKLARKDIRLKDYIVSVFIGVLPIFFVIGSIIFYFLFYKDNATDSLFINVALVYCLLFQLNLIMQQTIHSLDKIIKFQLFEMSKHLVFLTGAFLITCIGTLTIINLFYTLIFANTLAIVYVIFLLLKDRDPNKVKLAFSKKLIDNSFKAYINNILTFMTTRVDIFILKYFGLGYYEIGIYSLAFTLVEKLWIIPESIRSVLYLELSNKRKGDDFVANLLRLMIPFSFITGAALAIFAFMVPMIFGERFVASIMPLFLLLPGGIFFCYIKLLGTYFVVKEMLTVNTIMTAIIAIVNLILCVFLIPEYLYLGAAVAKSIAYISGAIYIVNKFRIVSGIKTKNILIIKKDDIKKIKTMFIKNNHSDI